MNRPITRRAFGRGAAALAAAATAPMIARAQQQQELVIVSFAGQLQEPHQWLARRMEARHPGLRIQLVPSESQDIVASIRAAQGYSPFDAMPNGEPPHLIAQGDGYIQRVHPERLSNYGNLIPEFVAKSGDKGA